MRKTSQLYISKLNDVVGVDGEVYEITDEGERDPVFVSVFDDVPEESELTAFTYGLSSANHSEWLATRPELVISVRSKDRSWAYCIGEIVKNYRAETLFEYGTILQFRQEVEEGCPLTSFLIFASNILDAAQQRIALPDRIINISQVYPIYESEEAIVRQVGAENFFFEMGIDFSDIHRKPLQLD